MYILQMTVSHLCNAPVFSLPCPHNYQCHPKPYHCRGKHHWHRACVRHTRNVHLPGVEWTSVFMASRLRTTLMGSTSTLTWIRTNAAVWAGRITRETWSWEMWRGWTRGPMSAITVETGFCRSMSEVGDFCTFVFSSCCCLCKLNEFTYLIYTFYLNMFYL